MIHTITYPNRTHTISCYLPDHSQPDRHAIAELGQMMELEETLERLAVVPGFFREEQPRIEKIIVTPDFHKGAGITIGTVKMNKGFDVPLSVGNDIHCGMSSYTTIFL